MQCILGLFGRGAVPDSSDEPLGQTGSSPVKEAVPHPFVTKGSDRPSQREGKGLDQYRIEILQETSDTPEVKDCLLPSFFSPLSGSYIETENWHTSSGFHSSLGRVRFFKSSEPHFEFANTCRSPIVIDGNTYLSVEHWFQCIGLGGPGHPVGRQLVGEKPEHGDAPRDCVGAKHFADQNRGVKKEAWGNKWRQEANWVMRQGLAAKFSFKQHPELAMKLLESWDGGANILVENNPGDQYWGAGRHGIGENKLGLMLMERCRALHEEWGSMNMQQKCAVWGAYAERFPQEASNRAETGRQLLSELEAEKAAPEISEGERVAGKRTVESRDLPVSDPFVEGNMSRVKIRKIHRK